MISFKGAISKIISVFLFNKRKGCGDILSHHDYYDHMTNTKVAGCMIARGALYKPWLAK